MSLQIPVQLSTLLQFKIFSARLILILYFSFFSFGLNFSMIFESTQ